PPRRAPAPRPPPPGVVTGARAPAGAHPGADTVLCILEDAMAAKRFRKDLESLKNPVGAEL
ncbi:MAG: hypothetical protein ACKOC6_08740, partial [bacterium]